MLQTGPNRADLVLIKRNSTEDHANAEREREGKIFGAGLFRAKQSGEIAASAYSLIS